MYVDERIAQYADALIAATHQQPRITRGAAPERAVVLLDAAKQHAQTKGRDYVTPQDVKDVAASVLRDAIDVADTVLPTDRDDVIAAILDVVEVP